MSTKPAKGAPLAQSRVSAARQGPRIPLFAVALIGLAVVLIAGLAVVALTRGGDDDKASAAGQPGVIEAGTQAFAPVTVDGDELPEYAGSDSDPAVGEPAPKLVGESPSGEAVTIDPAEGPMVLVFLAHWCPHCQAEVPRLVELAAGGDTIEGVKLVGVLTGSDPAAPNYPPGEWLAREGWTAPAMVDSEPASGEIPAAFGAYGVKGFPFMVAIDAEGNVAARSSGEKGEDGLRDFFSQVAP